MLQQCDMVINGKAIQDFGGATLRDYIVSAPSISSHDFLGINRTTWRLLKQEFGRRNIDITVIFSGPDMDTARTEMSLFNLACWGRVELFLPDGFLYDCRIESMGQAELVGDDGTTIAKIQGKYSFVGQQRKPMETVQLSTGSGVIFCKSTMPFTDCRLTTTVGASAATYSFGGATWENVEAGDALVFDGIDGLILRNGVNDATSVNWTVFPSLAPGANTFTSSYGDPVTVEYYPTFI